MKKTTQSPEKPHATPSPDEERLTDDGKPYFLTKEELEDLKRDMEESLKWAREHWDEIN